MEAEIKVGICVAYDWYLLKYSLPLIYAEASSICLSLDKDHVSWGSESYFMNDDEFEKLISEIDTDKKIKVLKEDFHSSQMSPRENEVDQRRRMAKFMGRGGWHIQIDCDEYFLNFKKIC